VKCETSPREKRKRLPGKIEKWNDDADSDEGEYEGKECNNMMATNKEDNFTEQDRDDNRNASDNGNEEDNNKDDDETCYFSDTPQWGSDTFEMNAVDIHDNQYNVLSLQPSQSNKRRNPHAVKVSSYCEVDTRNIFINKFMDDQVFTASSQPESYSASSQFSATAPTIVDTQTSSSLPKRIPPTVQKTTSSTTTSRNNKPSSSKSLAKDPPLSTSKIVTRANKHITVHEEDDENDNTDLDEASSSNSSTPYSSTSIHSSGAVSSLRNIISCKGVLFCSVDNAWLFQIFLNKFKSSCIRVMNIYCRVKICHSLSIRIPVLSNLK
jgi:hypothetical protein